MKPGPDPREKTGPVQPVRMAAKFMLKKDDSLLLIVDEQEKLAAAMDEKEDVIANTVLLLEAAKLLPAPVILTEQYSKGLGPTVPEVKAELPTGPQAVDPIEKITFDCFGEPSFIQAITLHQKRKIIMAGMETHICVLQTALGLLNRGYDVHVVSDAVCSRKAENKMTALQMMRDAGAVITSTETVLFQLLERADTPEFKTISRMVKAR